MTRSEWILFFVLLVLVYLAPEWLLKILGVMSVLFLTMGFVLMFLFWRD